MENLLFTIMVNSKTIKMANIEFRPVEQEEIPRRGKYREEVRQWVSKFLKLNKEKGVKAIKSNEFPDRDLAMSYYDSFKDHIKKQKIPIDVKIRKIRKNPTPLWALFLVKK